MTKADIAALDEKFMPLANEIIALYEVDSKSGLVRYQDILNRCECFMERMFLKAFVSRAFEHLAR